METSGLDKFYFDRKPVTAPFPLNKSRVTNMHLGRHNKVILWCQIFRNFTIKSLCFVTIYFHLQAGCYGGKTSWSTKNVTLLFLRIYPCTLDTSIEGKGRQDLSFHGYIPSTLLEVLKDTWWRLRPKHTIMPLFAKKTNFAQVTHRLHTGYMPKSLFTLQITSGYTGYTGYKLIKG